MGHTGVCMQLHKDVGADVEGQMDMHNCNNTCPNYNQELGSDRGAHLCTWLCKEGGVDMGSQVDMHICTDACTHSNQGMGPEEGWLGHASGATQQHTCLHATIQIRSSWHGEPGEYIFMYWCMPTF